MTLDRGVRLGPYEIVEVLGAGGMGEVYRARDARLGRDLAIKVLAPSLAQDAAALARFEREARTASSLNHPNIVHIYEIGEAATASGPVHYIAMEYIEGQTLRARLRAGERWKSLLETLTSVAEALAKAHKAGIVHRDLKPENVMITTDGHAKVVDFGLAKLFEGGVAPVNDMTAAEPDVRTGTGMLLGTPSYMSPEQARGKPADHRSDIFSFGCILYEATTGRRTFAADSAVATLHAIVYEVPPPVESLSAGAPAPLHGVVNKCLAKDPSQRYQSTADLVSDLRALARPTVTPNPDAVPTMALSGSTRPSGFGGSARRWLAGAAAALIAVSGAAVWRGRTATVPGHPPDPPPLQVEKLTNRGTVLEAALSGDGRYLVYSVTDPPKTVWLRDLVEKKDTRLVGPVEGSFLGRLRFARDSRSVYYSILPKGSTGSSIYNLPLIGATPRLVQSGLVDYSASPDERHVAQLRKRDGKSNLLVNDVETGQERDFGEVSTWSTLAWSADGSRLLFDRSKDGRSVLFSVSMDGTEPSRIAELSENLADAWWKPTGDGALLALRHGNEDTVRLQDLDLASGVSRPFGDRIWYQILARWLPDGTGIVIHELKSSSSGGALWLVDYPTGRARRIPADNGRYYDLSLSTDGEKLASVQSVGRSDILVSSRPDSGAFDKIVSGTDVRYRARWTFDGKILFDSNEGGTDDLYVADVDGSNRVQLTFDRKANENNAVASPDGRFIVFASDRSGERGLYRINRDGTGVMALTPTPAPAHADFDPQVTPDSKWVLYHHSDNGPSLWKVPIEGGPPILVRGTSETAGGQLREYAYGASTSPDGQLIAYFYITRDLKTGTYSDADIVVAGLDGTTVKRFPFGDGRSIGHFWRTQWSRDGRAIYYNGGRAGPKLWKQALAGGPPVQVTHFEEPLEYFDWSPDGKRLLVSRLSTLSDAVLITHFH